ncbi:CGNR zinc finger domain-containing protein [Mesorhizobium sp. M0047]|uniref:CGNR zinc finger domain-containing protein n=1 Tax=Mesorhizobium sp. M0047 TaxID=2956859 RepID=UPI003337B319
MDFLATVGERGHRDIERLRSLDDLAGWIKHAGISTQETLLKDSDLSEAKTLRDVMVRVLEDLQERRKPDVADIGALNQAAKRPPLRPELGAEGHGVVLHADVLVPSVLSTLARDFIQLVGSGEVDRVKRCADPTCNMFFLDKSRANNRIWCATEGPGCGNKAKKRAFVARHRHAE